MHPDWLVTAAAAFDTEWALAIFVALTLADALGDRTPSAGYTGCDQQKTAR
jgi:hypothetical protein